MLGDGFRRPILRRPTKAQIVELARSAYFELGEEEALELQSCVGEMVGIVDELMALPTPPPVSSRYASRSPGGRPTAEQDPLNVFTRLCDVVGADTGPLRGKTVGLKDNIDVGGIPTTNASATLAYTPSSDAVVVERILAAGGRIVGKLNMDNYAFGATGETSALGAPRNPIDPSRSAGGSSGGSGAAVRSGAVDLALGGDQGGSARIPASFCGVVALKATHGLIPSHGMTHLDHTFDSIVPMARSVEEVALLLTVIAGEDPRDPQWVRGPIRREDYADSVMRRLTFAGKTVGIVRESVPEDLCDEAVLTNVRRTASILEEGGAHVREISIPLWAHGSHLTQTLLAHLMTAMVESEGEGYGHLGAINVERLHAFALKRRLEGALLPTYLKTWILTAKYLHQTYFNLPYAMLHNLRLVLRDDIEKALREVDILLAPTTPTTAPPLLTADAADADIVSRVLGSLPYNTAPLNISGHPAIAIPNGTDPNGLPTSAEIICRRFEESLALRVGLHIQEACETHSGGEVAGSR